jgi:hypothetical protein
MNPKEGSETIAQAETNAQQERTAEAMADSHISETLEAFPQPTTQVEEMVDQTTPLDMRPDDELRASRLI